MKKIYTKFGDSGKTKLISGEEVHKSHIVLETCGNLDELNASLGLLRAKSEGLLFAENLLFIQERLFSISVDVSYNSEKKSKAANPINKKDVEFLEKEIDKITEKLPPLKHFIFPGSNELSALCHLSRTVCRRAERSLVRVQEKGNIRLGVHLKFLNRLSDYLFTLAREINFDIEKKEDKKWV